MIISYSVEFEFLKRLELDPAQFFLKLKKNFIFMFVLRYVLLQNDLFYLQQLHCGRLQVLFFSEVMNKIIKSSTVYLVYGS